MSKNKKRDNNKSQVTLQSKVTSKTTEVDGNKTKVEATATATTPKIIPASKVEPAKVITSKVATATIGKKTEAEVLTAIETAKLPNTSPTITPTSTNSIIGWCSIAQERWGNGRNASGLSDGSLKTVNKYIDELMLCSLIRLKEEGQIMGGALGLILNADQADSLREVADELGIKLSAFAELPLKEGEETPQLKINFGESKIPDDLKSAAKKDIEIDKSNAMEVPETDPSKITEESQVKTALDYILRKYSGLQRGIAEAIDWFRDYKIFKAGNDAATILTIKGLSINDLFTEIISISTPTLFYTGLGSANYNSAKVDGCPLGSFLIMRNALCDDKGVCSWPDENVAELTKSTIIEMAKKKHANDTTPVTDEALNSFDNCDEALIDRIIARADKDNSAKKIYGLTLKNYFKDIVARKEGLKGAEDQIRFKIGQIVNLFRPSESKLEAYVTTDTPISEKKKLIDSAESLIDEVRNNNVDVVDDEFIKNSPKKIRQRLAFFKGFPKKVVRMLGDKILYHSPR